MQLAHVPQSAVCVSLLASRRPASHKPSWPRPPASTCRLCVPGLWLQLGGRRRPAGRSPGRGHCPRPRRQGEGSTPLLPIAAAACAWGMRPCTGDGLIASSSPCLRAWPAAPPPAGIPLCVSARRVHRRRRGRTPRCRPRGEARPHHVSQGGLKVGRWHRLEARTVAG